MLTTLQIFYVYVLTVPVFFVVDMIWLGLIAKSFYAQQLGNLLAKNINWTAALIFYFAFIFGIIYFAVIPGIEKDSIKTVLINAALFGGLAYATYDLTNLATVQNWPIKLVFVDITWGVFLTSLVATTSYYIARWIQ